MAEIKYAGVVYDFEVGDENFENFSPVEGIDNLEFDTDTDEIKRSFVNGKSLTIQTKMDVSLTGRATDLAQENLELLLGDFMYEASAAVDSNDKLKLGTTGGLKLGLRRKIAVPGSIRLRPKIAAQQDRAINFIGASIDLGEPDLEDNLMAVNFKVSAQEVVIGEVSKKAN